MKCEDCGKEITGWFWYRWNYDFISHEARRETYCPDCAAAMVDEHTTNRLLVSYEEPRKK